MTATPLKDMARQRRLKLGHYVVEFATPGIGYLCKAAGCDFALFDMEHSGFHHETVKAVLRYFEAAGLPAIVRVPSQQYHHIARAADMGAEGIMVPMVADGAQAAALVERLKYPPAGRRGVALGIGHDRYRGGAMAETLAAANARTTLFAQIETRAGVDNADAIAAVDGIDCLWIGHSDLSADLGIPGDYSNPAFVDAVATVVAACRGHDKAAGRLVPDIATGAAYAQNGFDFICYASDVAVLKGGIRAGLDGIREAVADRGGER